MSILLAYILMELPLKQYSTVINFKAFFRPDGNRTGPLCSVGHWTGHARPVAGAPTVHEPGRPARRQHYRRQTTPTDDSVQNNTGPLGGPVIKTQSETADFATPGATT